MIVLPDSFDSEERKSVSRGYIPSLNRFHLIFETREEAEDVKRLLERLLYGEE